VPSDRTILLIPGRKGLNLRDHPSELAADELSDSVNWQIETRGSLTRRLGFARWTTNDTPDDILSLGRLRIAGGTNYLLAHCADGSLSYSTDGTSWTSIAPATTFSQTQPASMLQYNDTIYISDGSNPVQSWDGVTLKAIVATNDVQTLSISGTPTGGTFTVSFKGQTTSAIAYNASAADVQTALQAMSTIGTGNIICTGGALPGAPVVCTFGGTLAATPEPLMSHTDSFTGGTSPATSIAHTTLGVGAFPLAKYLAQWRGHVFAAGILTEPRTVRWSVVLDPTDWSVSNNNVVFQDAEAITGLYPSPPSAPSADGVDGLLVFKPRATYRIIDASDNTGGVSTGGSYELVDRGAGCWSHRSITAVAGDLYLLGEAGVYRTNGHSPLSLVSRKIEPLVRSAIGTTTAQTTAVGIGYKGRYFLSIPPVGEAENTRLLELYLDMPADQEGQHPWMAHDIATSALIVWPSTSDDILLGADSRVGAAGKVRQLFNGATDTDASDADADITAYAKSGGLTFDVVQLKRMKRIEVRGRGVVYIAVSGDFESGLGEQQVFQMPSSTLKWGDPALKWGHGKWGPGGGTQSARGRYSKRASFFMLDIRSTGSESGTSSRFLGLNAVSAGGAAIHSMKATFTPLDTW
jgi:hypothetical protein